ncbi:MAG TPA: RagB/SusD family nutrient uptake outer membrane protein [Chitinophagaceae bacterium]
MKKMYCYMVQLYCACLLLACFVLFSASCRKFVTIAPPENQVVTTTVFTDEQTAIAAVTGLYSQLMASNLLITNGGMSLYCGLSADELYRSSPNPDIDAFTANSLSAANLVNSGLWARAYQFIYHANACIEGLASSGISNTVKDQLIGELMFTRAFCYFLLVNLYGDAPLITTTDYRLNAIAARKPAPDVYIQIIHDLEQAQSLLPETYIAPGRIRPNKWTATTLLARTYLYMKDWAHAEEAATNVISSGMYSLVNNLSDVFIASSPEVIWQLLPVVSGSNTAEAASLIPASATAKPVYVVTNHLLNAFETGDQRKNNWIKTNTVSGQPYAYPYKYKIRSGTTKTEYNIVFRLAEIYLIRAEARAHLQKINESKTDIDKIRNRASLVPVMATDESSLLMAIEKERRVELFAEWGHRWLDLKRTERATPVLSGIKAGWSPNWQWYPLAESDLQRNPFLVQNTGY